MEELKISKLDSAKRQLEVAIRDCSEKK